MRKILYCLSLLVVLSGCAKFTDIDPKGKNLLSTVTDLDQLLNYQFGASNYIGAREASILVNDEFPIATNIPNLVSARAKTIDQILVTWDESEDPARALLTTADRVYELYYSIISKVANPVILMANTVSGDRDMANRLQAEARVLRAYFHYLLVNYYAKAYNPATAATDGGVPYVKETDPLSVPSHKHTVQEVYDFILEDLRVAIDLNSLPDKPVNQMRVGKAFAHAVEAKARVSMHDFAGAEAAANKALAIQNIVEDHRDNLEPDFDALTGMPGMFFTRPKMQNQEDLFYAGPYALPGNGLTPELSAAFEEQRSIFYSTVMKIPGDLTYGVPCDLLFSMNTFLNTTGLSTVDMLLTLAECKIRSGAVGDAMNILNDLQAKRVDPYSPVPTTNAADAFALLKKITRTETWYGIKHFISLKRWNTEDAYKATLRKTLLDVDYELRPDSPLWIFPFPQNAVGLNENLTQNYEE
jgi:hypothetical protein